MYSPRSFQRPSRHSGSIDGEQPAARTASRWVGPDPDLRHTGVSNNFDRRKAHDRVEHPAGSRPTAGVENIAGWPKGQGRKRHLHVIFSRLGESEDPTAVKVGVAGQHTLAIRCIEGEAE